MAVITRELSGLDLLIKANGNVVGGKDDATITFSRESAELPPTSATGTLYGLALVGLRSAEITFNSLWLSNSAAVPGFATGLVEVGTGTSPSTLNGVTNITIALSRAAAEFQNDQHAGWLARRATVLRSTLSVALDYFDPNSTTGEAYGDLQDAFNTTGGKETVKVTIPGGGGESFEAEWVIEEIPIGGGQTDPLNNTIVMQSNGDITRTTDNDLDSGLSALLGAIFATTGTTTTGTPVVTGLISTDVASNEEYDGNYIVSNLEITIPIENSEDGVQISGTLVNDGQINFNQT